LELAPYDGDRELSNDTASWQSQHGQEAKRKKSKKKKNSKKDGSERPAWSLTQEQSIEKEEREVQELLDFAQTLDFNQIIADDEVKEALQVIHARVQELSLKKEEPTQPEASGSREADQESDIFSPHEDGAAQSAAAGDREKLAPRPLARPLPALPIIPESGSDSGEQASSLDENDMTWDRSVSLKQKATGLTGLEKEALRSSRSIRSVHSTHSVRALIERIMEKKANAAAKGKVSSSIAEPSKEALSESVATLGRQLHFANQPSSLDAKAEPVVSVIQVREKRELDPNVLPYLHRNPAI